MPGFNQRGPDGQGPMTGRRMGRCTNFGHNERAMTAEIKPTVTTEIQPEQTGATPQSASGRGNGRGNGLGHGRGCGAGHRHRGNS